MFSFVPVVAVRGDGITCYFSFLGQPITGWTWKRSQPTQIRFGVGHGKQSVENTKVVAKKTAKAQTTAAKKSVQQKPLEVAEAASALPLTMISGLGPKLEHRLNEQGITTLDQIASWNISDIEAIEEKMGNLQNRIRRDDWVGQAKELLGK